MPSAYGRNANAALVQRANDLVFASFQIERHTALAEIEAIAAIDNLDGIALGPWDLAVDLGHVDDVRYPEVEAAIQRVVDVARRAGKPVGSRMGDDPELALDYARRGVQWIQVGNNVDYLIRCMDQVYGVIKSA